MNNYSAQGSITVKRLRNGDVFFITFKVNGIPLYQGVDTNSGSVSPDWSVPTNQPIITPQVTSARGNVVTLVSHKWVYNGETLIFNGVVTGDWTTDSTGKFQINESGALKIIANLASKSNIASDNLTYSCLASSAGVEYSLTKSIDIQIQSAGASSYYGTVNAVSEQLTETVNSTVITTHLYIGTTEQSGYYIKWYKDDTLWVEKTGTNITVNRGDVEGTQLIIAEFYKSNGDSSPVFRAGIRIIDTLDDFHVGHRFVNSDGTTNNANREVDINKPVYVQAYVVNVRTNAEMPILGKWKMSAMDKDTWMAIKIEEPNTKSATCIIAITTAETDVNGVEKDIEIVSEVEWEI